ncbi:MAG: methylated-DNA--[protein]-cysteine S-methyltransferase [Faecalibacterium sp.]
MWELLLQIPYGQTTTYGALAQQLAAKQGKTWMSAQAVGGAVGHNEISIIIPCHRVVGTSGSLTGYAGGIEKKCACCALEHVDMRPLFLCRQKARQSKSCMRKSIDHERVFAMQYTKLGNSDLNVSKVCIGCKMSQIALDVTLTPEEVEYLEELICAAPAHQCGSPVGRGKEIK